MVRSGVALRPPPNRILLEVVPARVAEPRSHARRDVLPTSARRYSSARTYPCSVASLSRPPRCPPRDNIGRRPRPQLAPTSRPRPPLPAHTHATRAGILAPPRATASLPQPRHARRHNLQEDPVGGGRRATPDRTNLAPVGALQRSRHRRARRCGVRRREGEGCGAPRSEVRDVGDEVDRIRSLTSRRPATLTLVRVQLRDRPG